MKSRLAAVAAAKFNRVVFLGSERQAFVRRFGGATTTGRTADPALHGVEPEEVDVTEAIPDEKRRHPPENEPTTKDNESYLPPNSRKQFSPKLESSGVGPRTDPLTQQKRRSSTFSHKIDDVSCAGIDGTPWPEDREIDRKTQREEQERDNREYFEHRKASPLSDIDFNVTDSRVDRGSEGIVENYTAGYGSNVWRPEQVDTAEDSLRRAMEIFRRNAMRGDPDSPHGRVLREMRGEYW